MPQTATTPTTSLTSISKADFGYDQARHLLWRAGFGGSPDQIRTLADWGPERAVDHLLDFGDEHFGDFGEIFLSDLVLQLTYPVPIDHRGLL